MNDSLMETFLSYERALMADDVAELDRLFAPGEGTLRGDAAGLLVGHDTISRFRSGRGGAPRRRIVETHVQELDEGSALIVAVTEFERGGRGLQTQLWRRGADGWQVTAAHVSAPAQVFDSRIWRVVGDPLVAPLATGPLDGETIAVKDLFAVQGQRIGAGNPVWLDSAAVEQVHSEAVAALLQAGASVRGIARTDELAYSLAGTNAHYGTPPNPKAPYRISGGSSSGPAAAVSLGHATIGLGTDTGGSVRVPAAYQGLFGIRTTHGAVSRRGLLPLAPSFDTVGWLTRDAQLLHRVGELLLPPAGSTEAEVVLATDLLELADPEVAAAVGGSVSGERVSLDAPLADWAEAFRTVQAHEAWQQHGAWLEGRLDALGPEVRARFSFASTVSDGSAEAARGVVRQAAAHLHDFLADRVLVLPATPSVAPPLGSDLERVRDATLRLTCLAGLGGLPAVVVPLSTQGGLPCGACFVAAPGRDRDLLDLVAKETR